MNKPKVETKEHVKFDRLYWVVLLNDDINEFSDVVEALQQVFRFTYNIAYAKTMEAHQTGASILGEFKKEVALRYVSMLSLHNINATIQMVD